MAHMEIVEPILLGQVCDRPAKVAASYISSFSYTQQ